MFNIQLNDASLGMSFDEFHYNVVAQHFSNYTESQAKMAFDDCDLDKNGHLTSEEFMMLCKKFQDGDIPDESDGEAVCVDTAPEGAVDIFNDNCTDYTNHPGWCGDAA